MSGAAAAARFAPQGALTMRTAPALLDEGRRRAAEGDLVVDLAAVTEADSAALALLLDWLRAARAAGHSLKLCNLPQGLASLALLYDLDAVLPREGET
ncbi:STAS domain-containing protein [Thauera aromatica]|uniref:STAS super family protein n=1 Tax=Thauera aromatica K172 TaxID=44139 RepID=A0A2R4BJR7_THAAR|nr:STAS domain-containing protein [Thauera aromatica]AVR87570.1 STAS super family protein [Thauera aromatica K172]MCK2096405.1 STAS domain-containing protein [Thauera aromatica]